MIPVVQLIGIAAPIIGGLLKRKKQEKPDTKIDKGELVAEVVKALLPVLATLAPTAVGASPAALPASAPDAKQLAKIENVCACLVDEAIDEEEQQ